MRLRGITVVKLDKKKVLPLILGNISSQISSQIFMIHKGNLQCIHLEEPQRIFSLSSQEHNLSSFGFSEKSLCYFVIAECQRKKMSGQISIKHSSHLNICHHLTTPLLGYIWSDSNPKPSELVLASPQPRYPQKSHQTYNPQHQGRQPGPHVSLHLFYIHIFANLQV